MLPVLIRRNSPGILGVNFDGLLSSISLGSGYDWEYTQPFTINVYVYPQYQEHGGSSGTVGLEAQQTVISNAKIVGTPDGSYSEFRGWDFRLFDSGILNNFNLTPSLTFWNSPQSAYCLSYASGSIPINKLTMITVSSAGDGIAANFKFWIDGVPQTTTNVVENLGPSTIIPSPSVGTYVGNLDNNYLPDLTRPPSNHYYFKGQMANLTIWNIALPDASVSALFAAGISGNPTLNPSVANLIDWYSFQGNTKDGVGPNNGIPTAITYGSIS